MTIAVLGWGSLCWDPRELRIRDGWHPNGPHLPVEFARVSSDGRLTLVLLEKAESVQVLWVEMDLTTPTDAIQNLSQREKTSENNIGCVDLEEPKNNRCQAVAYLQDLVSEWARNNNLDAVIWTDLKSNFHEMTRRDFSEDGIIAYLNDLDNSRRKKAEEYIRRAPVQITTKMRAVIEQRLGWTPIEQ